MPKQSSKPAPGQMHAQFFHQLAHWARCAFAQEAIRGYETPRHRERKWLSRAKAHGRRENLCRGNSATTLNGHDCDASVHSRDIGTPCGGNPRGSISSASPALAVAGETSWCHLFRLMNVIALITTVDVGFSKHTVLSLVARARSIARQPGHFGSCRQSGRRYRCCN